MPGTTPDTSKLGPGTLTVGELGTEVDFSCQVTGAILAPDVSADDDIYTLGGCIIPGAAVYTYGLSGTLYQDLNTPDGILAYSWNHPGEVVAFVFTASTAAGVTVTGELRMDPLPYGFDTANERMTSDFDWAVVGVPTMTWPDLPLDDDTRTGELVDA